MPLERIGTRLYCHGYRHHMEYAMRLTRYSLLTVAAGASASLALMGSAAAQQASLPMGRMLGDACTRSVEVPPQAFGPLRSAPLPEPTPAPADPTRLVKVREDVYAIVNVSNTVMPGIVMYGGNVAIYLTDEGVVLVDSKNESMHDDLVAKVRSLTDAPIKYVVLTHNHADHSGGAARLQALGATVILSGADRERMAAAGRPGGQQPQLPQMTYDGHAEIVLGGKTVHLLEFCGHTRGDTVVYLPDARVVIAGDLVSTPDSIPQITNYADGGNWTDLVNALDAVAKLDFDSLIGGHGPVLTKQQFLEHRDRIAAIRERARELVRSGRSEEAIREALTAEFNWGTGPAAGNIPGMMREFE
jgi:cyclase